MRHVPATLSLHPVVEWEGSRSFGVPTITVQEFWERLTEIAGRQLTEVERQRADEMANHGWLFRPIAAELFGEEKTDLYFAPQD